MPKGNSMKLKNLIPISVFMSLQASSTVISHSPYVFDYSKVKTPYLAAKAQQSSANNEYEVIGKFEVAFVDEEGVGVKDTTPYTTAFGVETNLGDYRKEIITKVVNAYSNQFNFGNFTPQIEISFENNDGFLALTFGPSFSDGSSYTNDPYGIIEDDRRFPSTLAYSLAATEFNLKSNVSSTLLGTTDYLLQYSDGMDLPNLAYVVYHELTHVVGFVATDCPSENVCLPEPSVNNDHMQKYFVYDNGETTVSYESLDIAGRLEAGLSIDGLWFSGSEKTRAAVADELVSGHDDGRIFMHATPQLSGRYQGDFDGQTGSHVSFDIKPNQLMYSAGAFVEDLGTASYILCDIGWCRDDRGNVIDLKSEATISGNKTEAGNTLIVVNFQNLSNVNIDVFNALIDYKALNVINVIDQDDLCTDDALGLTCTGFLGALGEQTVTLEVQSSDNYQIGGFVRSAGFDVDRNGFNNLIEIKENIAPLIECNDASLENGEACEIEVFSESGDYPLFQFNAFDPNGDRLTYTFDKIGDALDFSTSGQFNERLVIEIPAPETRWKTSSYTLIVDDGEFTKEVTLNLTNALFQENEAPGIICGDGGSIPCPLQVLNGQVLVDSFTYFDNNPRDFLTFSWAGQGEYFPFTTTGDLGQYIIVHLPEEEQTTWEKATYTLTISDGLADASLDFELINIAYEVNTAPTIDCSEGADACSLDVDGVGEYILSGYSVNDNDLDSLQYSWSSSEGAFEFTLSGEKDEVLTILFPAETDTTWESVSYALNVTDGEFSASKTFTLNNSNYAPATPAPTPTPTNPTPPASGSDSSGGGSSGIYWLMMMLLAIGIRRVKGPAD
jgi:hypothetical protein